MSNFNEFCTNRDQAIRSFEENNSFLDLIKSSRITQSQYRSLLNHLYYQVLKSSVSFATAGANCLRREKWQEAGEYLIHHANDEKSHYNWIVDDARAFGGLNRDTSPPVASISYVAFNYYVAHEFPPARLAIASFLEGVAAKVGPDYIPLLISCLNKDTEHFSFFTSHVETDEKHIVEIENVVSRLQLRPCDWDWMNLAVQTAADLYKDIYNAAARHA